MQGNPFSEVFWMGLLTHKLGVFGRFWKRFRGIFICAFGKQECGEVTGGDVFAFGRKLFDVLAETLRRLAVSGILTVVWGELGGVEEVSFSSCGGWMKCIVVSFLVLLLYVLRV